MFIIDITSTAVTIAYVKVGDVRNRILQGGAPQVISQFIIPLTIDISPINHSYWSYKPTQLSRGHHLVWIYNDLQSFLLSYLSQNLSYCGCWRNPAALRFLLMDSYKMLGLFHGIMDQDMDIDVDEVLLQDMNGFSGI